MVQHTDDSGGSGYGTMVVIDVDRGQKGWCYNGNVDVGWGAGKYRYWDVTAQRLWQQRQWRDVDADGFI